MSKQQQQQQQQQATTTILHTIHYNNNNNNNNKRKKRDIIFLSVCHTGGNLTDRTKYRKWFLSICQSLSKSVTTTTTTILFNSKEVEIF